MKQHLYVFIIGCIHLVLATTGYVPLVVTLPLSMVVMLLVAKYVPLQLSSTLLLHAVLYAVYIMSESLVVQWLVLIAAACAIVRESRLQQQVRHYERTQLEVNKQFAHMDELFSDVRKERHDLLKHVGALAYMLEQTHIDEAKAYMSSLVTRYEQTNVAIKGEHSAVAAILHVSFDKARSQNIALHYMLEVPISQLPVEADLLVQLIGNILDNAMDACASWQQATGEQGSIELSLRKKSGLYMLTCINHTIPLTPDVADKLFVTSGVTTKAGHSGLGTAIIEQIVTQHNGYVEFTAEKETFTLVCKLPHIA